MCHMCHGVACMCAHVVPIQVPDRLLPSPITYLQSAVRPGRCASNSVWPRSVTSTPHRVRTTYGRIEAGAGIEDRSPQYHALQPPPTCDACGRAHASCIRIRSHATPRAPRPRAPPRTDAAARATRTRDDYRYVRILDILKYCTGQPIPHEPKFWSANPPFSRR